MAEATIGVSPQTKLSLAAAKPEGMPWDDFLTTLLRSADTTRFIAMAESRATDDEAEAVERAKARYARYRVNPSSAISGTGLRRRVHLRRLAAALAGVQGSLRIAVEKPETADKQALSAALEDLDEKVHSARELVQAA